MQEVWLLTQVFAETKLQHNLQSWLLWFLCRLSGCDFGWSLCSLWNADVCFHPGSVAQKFSGKSKSLTLKDSPWNTSVHHCRGHYKMQCVGFVFSDCFIHLNLANTFPDIHMWACAFVSVSCFLAIIKQERMHTRTDYLADVLERDSVGRSVPFRLPRRRLTNAGTAQSVKYRVSVSLPTGGNPGSFLPAQQESEKRVHMGLVCSQNQIVHVLPATQQARKNRAISKQNLRNEPPPHLWASLETYFNKVINCNDLMKLQDSHWVRQNPIHTLQLNQLWYQIIQSLFQSQAGREQRAVSERHR